MLAGLKSCGYVGMTMQDTLVTRAPIHAADTHNILQHDDDYPAHVSVLQYSTRSCHALALRPSQYACHANVASQQVRRGGTGAVSESQRCSFRCCHHVTILLQHMHRATLRTFW